MKKILAGMCAVVVTMFTGCTVAEKPVGLEPMRLVAADWNGPWTVEGDQAQVEVIDAAKGLLRLSDVKKEKADEPLDVELRTAHGVVFYSAKLDDDDPDAELKGYLWGRIERTGNKVKVLMPDTEKFGAMVKSGKLPGKVDEIGNVTLGELTSDHLKALATGAFGNVWSEESFEFERAR